MNIAAQRRGIIWPLVSLEVGGLGLSLLLLLPGPIFLSRQFGTGSHLLLVALGLLVAALLLLLLALVHLVPSELVVVSAAVCALHTGQHRMVGFGCGVMIIRTAVFSDMIHIRRPSLANLVAVELPLPALLKTPPLRRRLQLPILHELLRLLLDGENTVTALVSERCVLLLLDDAFVGGLG